MLGLVLGGGGAKGAYEIGVWKALIEMGIDEKIKIAVGTSIGSLNAAFVAQGDYEKALEMWMNFDAGKMLHVENYNELDPKEKRISSIQALAKDMILEGGLEPTEYKNAILQYIDEEAVRRCGIRYGAVAVDITNQKPVEKTLEDMKKGQLVDYIMASSALAPAVKAYEIDGAKHIDGGFYDVVPVNMALDMGANEIIAVDLDVAGILKKTEDPERIRSMRYIKPYWDLGGVLTFDTEAVKRNIMLGYLDTLKVYDAFEGKAYTFIKDSKSKALEGFEKNSLQAIQTGISSNKSRFSFADNMMKKMWQATMQEREKRGCTKTNEIVACAEIVAEILKVDPTKLYTRSSLNEKIREKLAMVEAIPLRNSNLDILANLTNDLSAISDEQKRLKYFAAEIANDLENKRDIWIKSLAPIFTKEFFGGLYIAVHKLL
ncbi:MAG: patatin-like phospholipase family protein [Peptostreptococcaceae bacterium]|nr:patatin-like phospholipase family protein [Peptostreptococcaceae bacterium]